MPIFKSALVAPKAGAGRGEQGDIAGAADPHGLALFVPDLVIPDKPLNDLGHNGGFVFAHKIAIESALVVFVAILDRDFETGDGRTVGGSRAGCREGCETWLPGRL